MQRIPNFFKHLDTFPTQCRAYTNGSSTYSTHSPIAIYIFHATYADDLDPVQLFVLEEHAFDGVHIAQCELDSRHSSQQSSTKTVSVHDSSSQYQATRSGEIRTGCSGAPPNPPQPRPDAELSV
jgi:hypothetical protein